MSKTETDVAAATLADEIRRVAAVVEIATTHPEAVDLTKAYHDLTMVSVLVESLAATQDTTK